MGRRSEAGIRWWAVAVMAVALSSCSGDDDAAPDQTTTTTTTTTTIADSTTTTTTTEPEPLGEADLQRLVADTWQAIWVRDWPTVISAYDSTCRERLEPADFDATLGAGIDALTEGGIDPTATEVKVRVQDLIENESASVVSLLTFDGFEEAQEDDTGDWVVEDGAWRRLDCDAVAGAAAAGGAGSGPGSVDEPAA